MGLGCPYGGIEDVQYSVNDLNFRSIFFGYKSPALIRSSSAASSGPFGGT